MRSFLANNWLFIFIEGTIALSLLFLWLQSKAAKTRRKPYDWKMDKGLDLASLTKNNEAHK